MLCGDEIRLGVNMPTIQETKVGWIVTDRYTMDVKHSVNKCMALTYTLNDLDEQIKFVWQMEEVILSAKKNGQQISNSVNRFSLKMLQLNLKEKL